MPPPENLTAIVAAKNALRRRIADRRISCAVATARVAQPLVWLDHAQATWSRMAPWVKLAASTWRGCARDGFWPRAKALWAAARLAFQILRQFREV